MRVRTADTENEWMGAPRVKREEGDVDEFIFAHIYTHAHSRIIEQPINRWIECLLCKPSWSPTCMSAA